MRLMKLTVGDNAITCIRTKEITFAPDELTTGKSLDLMVEGVLMNKVSICPPQIQSQAKLALVGEHERPVAIRRFHHNALKYFPAKPQPNVQYLQTIELIL